MLISDLEQLEFLPKSKSIMGGENIQLYLNDDPANDELVIALGLDGQPALDERLPNGKSLTYEFFGKTSGSLTARRQRNGSRLTQSVSLIGTTETGANFSFSSTYTTGK